MWRRTNGGNTVQTSLLCCIVHQRSEEQQRVEEISSEIFRVRGLLVEVLQDWQILARQGAPCPCCRLLWQALQDISHKQVNRLSHLQWREKCLPTAVRTSLEESLGSH